MPNPPSPPRATMIAAMIPTICVVVLPRFPGIPHLSRHPFRESYGTFRHRPCPESNFGFSVLPLNTIDDVEQVVYFQPIWLEVIDFMWEGVLGTAVWGGSAESGECFSRRINCCLSRGVLPNLQLSWTFFSALAEWLDISSLKRAFLAPSLWADGAAAAATPAAPATASAAHGAASGEASVRAATAAARVRQGSGSGGGPLRSLSRISVTLAAPTIVLPGGLLSDPRHLALRPKSFRFDTWTGGADDT